MPNAQMNFRIDAELKRRGDERFARLGCTPSGAMRRLYECAARYDDESEALLRSLLKPEEASPEAAGERRAQAVLDFEEQTKEFYRSLGITHGLSHYPVTNEELREVLYEAKIERMVERGLW